MKQCGEERELESHTMHAYINQLAEHDVVACLHFFPPRSSFIDSVHVALLPHHIYLSFPFTSLGLEALRRGSRKIHHTWLTQKMRACVCGALYLKQHHVTYSMQCIHHFYVLAHMWCSAFFSSLLLPLPNPSQTNFIHSPTPLSPDSHSRNVDHKKAVFTFNIFFTPPVFMCVSPMMVEKKLFLPLHFSNWQSSEWIYMVWETVLSVRMLKKFSIARAVMGIFSNSDWVRAQKRNGSICTCLNVNMKLVLYFATAAVETQIWKK